MRQLYHSNDTLDAAIRRLYQAKPERGAVRDFAARHRRPRWWISRRAADLGIATPTKREPAWSETELAILERHYWQNPKTVQKRLSDAGFQRSLTAIAVKRRKERLLIADAPFVTANALAELCGVDPRTVAREWIHRLGLPAKRRGTDRTDAQGGDHWWIALSAFRKWVRDNRHKVDLRKVDQVWFYEEIVFPSRSASREAA